MDFFTLTEMKKEISKKFIFAAKYRRLLLIFKTEDKR